MLVLASMAYLGVLVTGHVTDGVVQRSAAAAALTRLGIWDPARAEHELAAYRELAARRGALTSAR